MPKFSIITLGCKVNQAESESIAQDLIDSDWQAARARDEADVCVVNTCTVTQKASTQSRQAIRQIRRTHPNARVVVTGCYAQTAPQELKEIAGITSIVGHAEKLSISNMIRTESYGKYNSTADPGGDFSKAQDFKSMPVALATPRTRPFLKVQDGCDAFCSYCIVPYARGRSRSISPDEVLQRIKKVAQAGYHEVVLTGIHLGAYGRDLSPRASLAMLLTRIRQSKPIDRVRLSSIEPLELNAEILQIITNSELFCHHLHIPLQSGDNGILKKMRRPYSRQSYHDLIRNIHDLMPEAAIGADALIGFPGESDAAFDNTYALIDSLPISYLHVFPFSARTGTPAAKFKGKIPHATIKDRCERMRKLGKTKRIAFYQKFRAKTLPVLIETKRDKATGLLKGISANYLPVLIDAGDELKNKIIDIKIERVEGSRLYGASSN